MIIQPLSLEIENDFKVLKSLNKISVMETCIRQIYTSWILKPGCVAIDIGAHKGLHTIPMSEKVGDKGRVFAFEANPYLAINLTKELIGRTNISIVNAAVSDGSASEVELFINNQYLGQSTIIKGYGNNFTDGNAVFVPCISIDNFLYDYLSQKRLAFVKIDAEGAELDILRGMIKLLQIKSPLICAEISMHTWITHRESFEEILNTINYTAFSLSGIELFNLSQNEIKSINSQSYTIVFCKKNHWTYSFASDPLKMPTLVKNLIHSKI